MFIPYIQIARNLRIFENSLADLYMDQVKGPTYIESCKREIERAEKEEEGEWKDGIIKAHTTQIEKTERDIKSGAEMIKNMLVMREDIIKTYFSGWKKVFLFFI